MHITDIACNKAYMLGRRPKWRDYVDLYFILKKTPLTLENIINHSLHKFGNDFSERLFLQQLVYWEDVLDYQITFLGEDVPTDEIKSFLFKEAQLYGEQELRKTM